MKNIIDLIKTMKDGDEYFVKAGDGYCYYEGTLGRRNGRFYYDLVEFSGYCNDIDNDFATKREVEAKIGHLWVYEKEKQNEKN